MRGRGVDRERGAPRPRAEHREVHRRGLAGRISLRCSARRPSRWSRRRPGPCGLGLLRLVHRLEVDFREHHRREAGAGADVGDDGAQVGIDDAGAVDAEDLLQRLFRDVADLEDAALLGLDQEQRLVVDRGRDRRRHRDLVGRLGDHLGAQPEVDLDLRLALLEQDLRRVRLLERQVLQVQPLDGEQRGVVGVVGHGELFEGKEVWARARSAAPGGARQGCRGGDYGAAASSGSRRPARSSAIRSSQPPTWVSPMKICGTV